MHCEIHPHLRRSRNKFSVNWARVREVGQAARKWAFEIHIEVDFSRSQRFAPFTEAAARGTQRGFALWQNMHGSGSTFEILTESLDRVGCAHSAPVRLRGAKTARHSGTLNSNKFRWLRDPSAQDSTIRLKKERAEALSGSSKSGSHSATARVTGELETLSLHS